MGHDDSQKEIEMDRVVKIFDWVVLGAAVLCSVFLGMGLGKRRGGNKETTVHAIGLMVFLLGISLRNVLKNKSWK